MLIKKMVIELNLIVAVSENMGIGVDGKLPWQLKSEMAYFTKMTTQTQNSNKKNVVLMGRNTWDCIPVKFRPLRNRINMVLSRNNNFKIDDTDILVANSLESAIEKLGQPEVVDSYESVWVIGGSHLYKDVMQSKYFYRLYLTDIMKTFECDTFMPKLPDNIKLIDDPDVPKGIHEENGIKFEYKVYENTNYLQ